MRYIGYRCAPLQGGMQRYAPSERHEEAGHVIFPLCTPPHGPFPDNFVEVQFCGGNYNSDVQVPRRDAVMFRYPGEMQ
jgi:hypothetical protein